MDQHGFFDIWFQDGIVYASVDRTWDESTALNFGEIFHQVVLENCHHRWGHLVYLHDWDLGVAGMEPIFTKLALWCVEHGLTHVAQVYSPDMMQKFQMDDLVHERLGCFESRQFSSDTDAQRWLEKAGYVVHLPAEPAGKEPELQALMQNVR